MRYPSMAPVVAVVSVLFAVYVLGMGFAVGTTCTNAWSCSGGGTSVLSCTPCRAVDVATIGALLVGAVFGAVALLGRLRLRLRLRARIPMYVLAMLITAVAATVVAETWSGP